MSLEAGSSSGDILKGSDTLHRDTKKDCLLCRLTGSVGLLGISAYVFFHAAKQPRRSNKAFLNFLGSGKASPILLLFSFSFSQVLSNF
jgi:hypothetical protein